MNTAEINKNFDFVDWVIKTPCLFYFHSVKVHYVKETYMMLVALVKIVVASQHKRQQNKSLSRFVDNLKLKVHALHYANELLVRIRPWIVEETGLFYYPWSDLPFKHFCKLAKWAETIRNYQKQVLVMIKHCLGNSQINLMPARVKSFLT